ncbi:MAG: hypothetical protein R3Y26_09725, partial [Rikenellaceae bacterium]
TDYLFFDLWGGVAVPVFLLIQVFHYLRKVESDNYSVPTDYFNIYKIFNRIIKPFLVVILIELVLLVLMGRINIETLINFCKKGGYGAGSYYFWIYLQFWLLIPCFVKLYKKIGILKFGVVSLLITIFFDYLCVHLNIPIEYYRLLFFRYFFIIFLGVYTYKSNNRNNLIHLFFGVLGMVYIINQNYFEPIYFAYDIPWNEDKFPAYIYMLFILLPLVKRFYRKSKMIEMLGKYSYEIYLSQMLVFFTLPGLIRKTPIANNEYLYIGVNFILTTLFSITPVYLYYKYKQHLKLLNSINSILGIFCTK